MDLSRSCTMCVCPSRFSTRACCVQRPSDPSTRLVLCLAPCSPISLLGNGCSTHRGRWCIIVRRGGPRACHKRASGASSYDVSRSLCWAGPGTSPSAIDANTTVPRSERRATRIEAAVAAAAGVRHDLLHLCAEVEASLGRCGHTEGCKFCCSDRISRCSGSGSSRSGGSDHPCPGECSARWWRCSRTASTARKGRIATSRRPDRAWWQLGKCIAQCGSASCVLRPRWLSASRCP